MSEQITELAERMKWLMETKDALSADLRDTQKELDDIRMTRLPAAMEEEGIESIRLANIGTVSLRDDVWASVPAPTRDMAWNWLRDNGFAGLITETINGSTFKAWAKEQLKEGTEIPEDLFKITPYTYAVITK